MIKRLFSSRTPVALALLIMCGGTAAAQQTVRLRIWVKAFIPKSNPLDVDYIKGVPGTSDRWMLPGPTRADHCFLTDHREFSSDRAASARVTTDFILRIDGNKSIVELPNPHVHTPGTSTQVDCATGKVLGEKPGKFSRLHSIGSKPPEDAIGQPGTAGTQTQIIFGVATTNPFAPPVVAPAIDYSLDLTYDRATKKITYAATLGNFPAYEAYAQLDNGEVVALFRAPPAAKSAWGLYDFGTGIGTHMVKGASSPCLNRPIFRVI